MRMLTMALAMSMIATVTLADAVDSATDFIAREEGFRNATYICPGGGRTIGYGCTDPEVVAKGWITETEAREVLKARVTKELRWIRSRIPGLTEGQQVAVCSLVYNIGRPRFLRSKAYKALREGRLLDGITEMTGFCKANGKISAGLQKRRERERKMFLGE